MYNLLLNLTKEYDTLIHRPSIDVINNHFKGRDIRGAEIGVSFGKHAKMLLKGVPNLRKLYLVDPFFNYEGIDSTWDMFVMREKAHQRLDGFDSKHFIEKTSADAAKLFHRNELDFCYIDGNHNYEFVKQDIELWYPVVNEGGLLMGHDFQDPEVARAVLDQFPFCVHTRGYPVTWWIEK